MTALLDYLSSPRAIGRVLAASVRVAGLEGLSCAPTERLWSRTKPARPAREGFEVFGVQYEGDVELREAHLPYRRRKAFRARYGR